MEFENELELLINKYSKENESDTPDFVLAEYLKGCLDIYSETVQKRDKWYGFKGLSSRSTISAPTIPDEVPKIIMNENLRLFVWTDFCSAYTRGVAFAIAHTTEEAMAHIKSRTCREPNAWGTLSIHPLNEPYANCVQGGG